jgi:N6-adenosine-specific RNA methylase IME4
MRPESGSASSHELLLVEMGGDIPPLAAAAIVHRVPAGRGGQRPARFYEMIESYLPSLAKVENDARTPREGGDAWGDEAP